MRIYFFRSLVLSSAALAANIALAAPVNLAKFFNSRVGEIILESEVGRAFGERLLWPQGFTSTYSTYGEALAAKLTFPTMRSVRPLLESRLSEIEQQIRGMIGEKSFAKYAHGIGPVSHQDKVIIRRISDNLLGGDFSEFVSAARAENFALARDNFIADMTPKQRNATRSARMNQSLEALEKGLADGVPQQELQGLIDHLVRGAPYVDYDMISLASKITDLARSHYEFERLWTEMAEHLDFGADGNRLVRAIEVARVNSLD